MTAVRCVSAAGVLEAILEGASVDVDDVRAALKELGEQSIAPADSQLREAAQRLIFVWDHWCASLKEEDEYEGPEMEWEDLEAAVDVIREAVA